MSKIRILISVFLYLLCCVASSVSCNNKGGFKEPWEYAGGYVIAKESCNADETKDYWLVDLTIYPNTKQYGDSLEINGILYTNVVKTLDLLPKFKVVGKRVGFDFYISGQKVVTSGCNLTSPVTFTLKEMDVVTMGEIR